MRIFFQSNLPVNEGIVSIFSLREVGLSAISVVRITDMETEYDLNLLQSSHERVISFMQVSFMLASFTQASFVVTMTLKLFSPASATTRFLA